MKEISISEKALRRWIAESQTGGEFEDKGLNAFLQQFFTMSCLWRDPLNVILTNGNSDSQTTEEYQKYLDDCASGIESEYHGTEN